MEINYKPNFKNKKVKEFFIKKIEESGYLESYHSLRVNKINSKCIYHSDNINDKDGKIYFSIYYELPSGRRDSIPYNFYIKELEDYLN